MAKVVIELAGSEYVCVSVPSGSTAAAVAAEYGVTDTNKFDEVADNAFTADEIFFSNGFRVTAGTATWTIANGRTAVRDLAISVYSRVAENQSQFASGALLAAQASLASGSRDATINALLTDINTTATTLTGKLSDISSAADAAALKTIFDSFPVT